MLDSTSSMQSHNFTFNEYCGEMGSFSTTMEMKTGCNELWYWPHNISEGFLYAIKLRPGLSLAIIEHYAENPVNLSFDEQSSAIEFAFILAGDGSIAMADTLLYDRFINFGHFEEEFWAGYFPLLATAGANSWRTLSTY